MCCKAIVLPCSCLDNADKAKPNSDVHFALINWRPLTYEQAVQINPHHGRYQGRDDLSFWQCTKIDQETNRCTIHRHKPRMCKKYPWYEYKTIQIGQLHAPDCGFAVDCIDASSACDPLTAQQAT